ncbi:MAG: DUF4089 domain-containing protein [Pseudomonadota bacterium]
MKDKQTNPMALIWEKPTLLEDLAALAGVEIPGEHADAVRGHLATAARMAALVYDAPLADHTLDAAPVFTPADVDHD